MSKKGVQDTADQLQAPTPGVGQSNLISEAAAMPPFSHGMKREEVKMK
jgi:hypothetical protein